MMVIMERSSAAVLDFAPRTLHGAQSPFHVTVVGFDAMEVLQLEGRAFGTVSGWDLAGDLYFASAIRCRDYRNLRSVYLRFSLSLRDVEELMAERGLSIDHTTLWRWTQTYAPEVHSVLLLTCQRSVGILPLAMLKETNADAII